MCERQVAPGRRLSGTLRNICTAPTTLGFLCLMLPLREGRGLQAVLECASMGKSPYNPKITPLIELVGPFPTNRSEGKGWDWNSVGRVAT